MTDITKRKGSVTEADYVSSPDQGIFAWTIFDPGATLSPSPTLPIHGSRDRDRILTSTLDLEDMWASAVNKAVTKIAVRGYEVSDNDDSTRRTEFGKTLVMNFDGNAEYRAGMAKTVQDFLLCDNGWFVEVVRAGDKPQGKPQSLYHLDSFRCYRTGNLDFPVLYVDYVGLWHKLRGDQVIFGSDMPSPRSRLWNRGRCAASRAFQTIVKLSAMDVYFTEKITGSRALALHFIMGLSPKQLTDAMETSEAEKARKGHVVYKGAVMIPIHGDQPGGIQIASIDLASVPDGFDVEQVQKDGYRKYALALGLNPDELVQRSAGLNSGHSAQVAEQAAEEAGGLTYFVKDFEDKINYLVMPKPTIFQVKTNDVRDQKEKADLLKTKADTIAVMRGTVAAPGWITNEMALQLSVDEQILPQEFLPQDVTPGAQLTDSGDQSKIPAPTPRAPYAGQVMPAPVAPNPAAPAMKALSNEVSEALEYCLAHPAELSGYKRLHEAELRATKAAEPDEWEEAVKWAKEATDANGTQG